MEIQIEESTVEGSEIKKMMDLLSSLFSIRTSFIYASDRHEYVTEIAGKSGDYQEYCRIIQRELKQRCVRCDKDKFKEATEQKKPVLYRCYNGLYEMFLPLFIEGFLVGYLHFGQVRGEEDFGGIFQACALDEHSAADELEAAYNSMPLVSRDQLILISELFQKFADFILKDKLIEIKRSEPAYYLKRFIDENLDRPIDVNSAAEYIGRSPSYVTHKFKEIYGMTFHDYLSQSRIEMAMTLLQNHSITDTFPRCGFNNRYHFSKVFKKSIGMTPHEYQVECAAPVLK